MTDVQFRQTTDQSRSAHAWNEIQHVLQRFDNKDQQKEYGREAKKLPTRIIASGLGQALAFLDAKAKAKGDKPKQHLLRLHTGLASWTNERPISMSNPESLTESILNGDTDFLRRATDEALAYLQWLVRFADAHDLTDDEGATQA